MAADGLARPDPFSDPGAVSRYAEGPPRIVPGFHDLHRMLGILLAERAPDAARVLVLGAGGGLELKFLVQAQPGWSFDGIDPSAEMLKLAAEAMGPLREQATLHQGYIDDAPEGPFDAAACLLTLHFLAPAERLRTVGEIRRRLKPGGPFVVAHASFPQSGGERGRWLSRHAAFATAAGTDPARAEKARAALEAHLQLLSPEEDEAILRAAGFSEVSLFYAAFSFRGWVAYA